MKRWIAKLKISEAVRRKTALPPPLRQRADGDSELQRRDVVELLERAGHRLDLEYVRRWVVQLGLEAEWTALWERAQTDLGSNPDEPAGESGR